LLILITSNATFLPFIKDMIQLWGKKWIFATSLKNSIHHIALLLLAVFAVTMLPFNLLHHHAEDEHQMVMLAPADYPAHHCEMDDQFCQTTVQSHCGHKAHLQHTLTKCFSCEFHFIKHFESAQQQLSFYTNPLIAVLTTNVVSNLMEAIVLLSNKGPPSFA
jgi:hypothetical protein